MLPTNEQIVELHHKYAPDPATFDLIYTHLKIVFELALQIIAKHLEFKIDTRFVEVACLLHDIGAYTLFSNGEPTDEDYISHGIRGQEILENEGFDVSLCRIASHHTGVGITKTDIIRNKFPLPHQDFLAETLAEEVIMYADKYHSKSPKFNSYESYLTYVSKFGLEKADIFKEMAKKFGIPDLATVSKKYNHPII